MKELIDNEYVSGLKYIEAKDMESILEIGTFSITGKGREYLIDNSVMRDMPELLGETFKIVLGGVIGMM